MRGWFVFVGAFFVASFSLGADRFWINSGGGNWNDTANWSDTSGGSGGSSVPGSSDNVIFDGNGLGTCTINATVTVSTLTVSTSTTGSFFTGSINTASNTITATGIVQYGGLFDVQDSSITVNGNFALYGGTITNDASTIEVTQSFASYGGKFNYGTSLVILSGTGTFRPSSNQYFYSLSVAYSGKTTYLYSNSANFLCRIYGMLYLNGGTLTRTSEGYNANIVLFGKPNSLNFVAPTTISITMFYFFASGGGVINIPGGDYGTADMQMGSNSANSSTFTVTGNITTGEAIRVTNGNASPSMVFRTNGYSINAARLQLGGRDYYYNSIGKCNYFMYGSTISLSSSYGFYSITSSIYSPVYTIHMASSVWLNAGKWTTRAGGTSVMMIPGTSKVTFTGTSGQEVNAAGESFATIVSTNTSNSGIKFTSSFTATNFTINTTGLSAGATVYFPAESTATITNLNLTGDTEKYVVVLSTVAGTQTFMTNTGSNSVSYVNVKDNNASGGISIEANDGTCVDSGNNENWNFEAEQGILNGMFLLFSKRGEL